MSADKIIVTLVEERSGFSCDLELPSGEQIKQYLPTLAEFIMERGLVNQTSQHLCLYYNGVPLDEEDTLTQAGVWDGCILRLEYTESR